MNLQGLKSHGRLGVFLTALLAMLCASPAVAFQFNLGDANGSLDSTLSYGVSWRLHNQDERLISLQEGGTAYSGNFDDGNLNYKNGDVISNTFKITSDLALDYENFGLFVRGSAFYDLENEEGERQRTELRSEALDLVGSDIDLLDAYGWWNFEAGDTFGQLRVGKQVLSWGESTFIQNGINVINPFDVSKLRVPGAELKEGLVPVGMVSASISPTENLTFEAFYQYDWKKVEVDPPGSYWSTNDFAGVGGNKVMLGFGDVPDMGNAAPADTLLGVPRVSDIYADDDGQYGIAMRVYAPGLNDTEFGFYYMNYHSRLPVISSWTGGPDGLVAAATVSGAITAGAGGGGAEDIVAATLAAFDGSNAETSVYAGIAAKGAGVPVMAAGLIGQTALESVGEAFATLVAGGANPLDPATMGAAKAFVGANAAAIGAGVATPFATDAYAKTAGYQVEYPEDIKLFGMSFNTVLPKSGVALQGEISHRIDTPLQVDDLELLTATLEPLATGGLVESYSQYENEITPLDIIMNGAPIYIPGYVELDVTQAQTTATKLFGPALGADQFTMVGEVGVTYVHDMPSKSELRFDGPGTPVTGNPDHADPAVPWSAHDNKPAEPAGAFADDTSWGYRMVAKLDFNDAIGAITLSPRIAWAHDVSGNSPGPGGNFIEDRKAVTLGLGASYQSTWSADLSYTDFFGAGRYNLVNDRDFLALNIKYSF